MARPLGTYTIEFDADASVSDKDLYRSQSAVLNLKAILSSLAVRLDADGLDALAEETDLYVGTRKVGRVWRSP